MNPTRGLATSLLLFAALLLGVTGCGGEKLARLTGKVTYKGKEVPAGMVVFADENNTKIVRAKIEPDGNYTASVPYGQFRVGVEPASKGLAMPKGAKGKIDIPPGSPAAEIYAKKGGGEGYVDIPKHERDPATSKITVTVDGDKTFDVKLN